MAIGKALVRTGDDLRGAIRSQARRRGGHLADLPAVGTGVHKDAAANTAGDAVGKFQPRQPVVPGKSSSPGHGGTAFDLQRRLIQQADAVQRPGADRQPPLARIRRQDIRPRAQDRRSLLLLPGRAQQKPPAVPG